MKRKLVFTASYILLIACTLMGVFFSMGVCASLFGGEILDTVLRAKPEPNPTHPAFILFVILMIPGMIVGATGGLFGIVFPLYLYFRVPLGHRNESTRVWLRSYAKRLLVFTEENNGEHANTPNGSPSDA